MNAKFNRMQTQGEKRYWNKTNDFVWEYKQQLK